MRFLTLLLLFATGLTHADTLRCGNKLVYEGDVAPLVAERCGKPSHISHSTILKIPTVWYNGRPYQLSNQEVVVPVETWLYNFGPRKFMRKLRFEDGVLVEIEVLEYGY